MASNETPTYITPGVHPKPSHSNASGPVKPTILAFHGSGSNATVHTVQLARLSRFIKDEFTIESLEAPFPSPAGPGILPFFDGCGPFYRWMPPSEKVSLDAMAAGTSTSVLSSEVAALVASTVQRIRATGSRVIGLIGFSQGTKVVAGLLRASEIRREYAIEGDDWCDFKFGVSVCSSYAPGLIPSCILDKVPEQEREKAWDKKITSPAFLVQGSQDEWNWAGKGLIERHYEVGEGKGVKIEWDIGHHYPVKAEESERIAEWIRGVVKGLEGERGEVR